MQHYPYLRGDQDIDSCADEDRVGRSSLHKRCGRDAICVVPLVSPLTPPVLALPVQLCALPWLPAGPDHPSPGLFGRALECKAMQALDCPNCKHGTR